MKILGLHSSFTGTSHDSSASLIVDGKVLAAIEEERLSRRKSSSSYPAQFSVRKCLEDFYLQFQDLDLITCDAITYPFMKEKLYDYLAFEFGKFDSRRLELVPQSDCHLWGAYFESGFCKSLVFDVEGVGDGISTKVSLFDRVDLSATSVTCKTLYECGAELSLGKFYTAMTQFLGFEAVEGEYKVMGMAAYGNAKYDMSQFINFSSQLGEFSGNSDLYLDKPKKTCISEPVFARESLERFFGIPARQRSEPLNQAHFDIAASVQSHFEYTYLSFVSYWVKKTGISYVSMSGGCALNAVANMKLLELNLDGLFVMPAASDRGVSLGAAVLGSFKMGQNVSSCGSMYLGSSWTNNQIERELSSNLIDYQYIENCDSDVAESLENAQVVGLFRGRSEFGPRALGARSILANPRIKGMKDKINSKIKFREEFRPFAPAILQAEVQDSLPKANFEYMNITVPLENNIARNLPEAVHFDGTSRIQMVKPDNPVLGNLLMEIKKLSGHGSIINTSFNLKGEPIVDSPKDAIRTFFSSGIDVLYLGNFKVTKPRSGTSRNSNW